MALEWLQNCVITKNHICYSERQYDHAGCCFRELFVARFGKLITQKDSFLMVKTILAIAGYRKIRLDVVG